MCLILKQSVHDIDIVGVVLACNNYEVVDDLEKILEEACFSIFWSGCNQPNDLSTCYFDGISKEIECKIRKIILLNGLNFLHLKWIIIVGVTWEIS